MRPDFFHGTAAREATAGEPEGQSRITRLVASGPVSPRVPYSFQFVKFVLESFQLTSAQAFPGMTAELVLGRARVLARTRR